MLKFLLPILALMLASSAVAGDKPNVLFIAVDDLNHWVHYLGRNAQSITPNIDKLAARGVRLIGPIGPIGPIFPATESEGFAACDDGTVGLAVPYLAPGQTARSGAVQPTLGPPMRPSAKKRVMTAANTTPSMKSSQRQRRQTPWNLEYWANRSAM